LLKRIKATQALMRKTPCSPKTDKAIKYIRYADDFIIGVKGSRADCEYIRRRFAEFISQSLKMELSEEKTLITHSNQYARFLGYDIRVRRDSSVKPHGKHLQRTMNGKVELCVPFDDKIMPFLFQKSIAQQQHNGAIEPIARKFLYSCTDLEIVTVFNSELRGICNYYALASNFNKLSFFAYLMEYSCLKTLAGKHKTTSRQIIKKNPDGEGGWHITYKTKKGTGHRKFANFMDCKKNPWFSDIITSASLVHGSARSPFESRLAAEVCELCGKTGIPLEMHHVNKVKNLKGKTLWETTMIAKRRKTIAVCVRCHCKIHHP